MQSSYSGCRVPTDKISFTQMVLVMAKRWSDIREDWLSRKAKSLEASQWAISAISENDNAINAFEESLLSQARGNRESKSSEEELKGLKRLIKNGLTSKENELDDLTLNTPNSYKLQLSVPTNLSYLMKAWAAAEGRDLSSVALQCLEIGLRDMKSKGSIPQAAVKRYDAACERRITLAEINHEWEKHELTSLKNDFIAQ